jgi:hypothetical protein
MFFRMLLFVWEFALDLAAVMRRTTDEKDLELMLRRQQLRIVERKQPHGPVPRMVKKTHLREQVRVQGVIREWSLLGRRVAIGRFLSGHVQAGTTTQKRGLRK